MEYRFDRAYYRIVYPLFLRPSLQVGDHQYPVADLSEGGIHLLVSPPDALAVGDSVAGSLRLPGEERVLAIAAAVVRVDGCHVGLRFLQGVPFALILDQQRLLQQRVLGLR
ncbi:MAG: PilZ domain-containing protein [Gemmatimonadetes bacterium]|nr:PilZ domain-containing protein [Gemmatimonadota bacterium]